MWVEPPYRLLLKTPEIQEQQAQAPVDSQLAIAGSRRAAVHLHDGRELAPGEKRSASATRAARPPCPAHSNCPPAGSRSGGGGESSNRLRDQYASRKEQAKSVDYSPSSPQLQASSRSKSSDNQQQHRRSVPSVTHGSTTPRLRDREHRSESGRRRSLERSVGLDLADGSPPSDHFLYDNLCYATTPPSSSNDSGSEEGDAAAGVSGGGGAVASGLATPRRQASHEESPTSKLLMEYETHLRNALARGMDAESYSLHTFEALLTQSMENVGQSNAF
ncbi:hypothetical protein MTO96_008482 [Rhipicephalus appendiculatus]